MSRNQLQETFCHFVSTFPQTWTHFCTSKGSPVLSSSSPFAPRLTNLCFMMFGFVHVFYLSDIVFNNLISWYLFSAVLNHMPALCILLLPLGIEFPAIVSNKSSSAMTAFLHLYSFDSFSIVLLSTLFCPV